jgi:hypothetical protein
MAGGALDGKYTYDLTIEDGGPRVPDEIDLGGVQMKNGDPPPQKGAEEDADMTIVQTYTLAGLVRMAGTCRLSVEFDAIEMKYVIARVASMGTLVAADMFALDNSGGTGDVIISWNAGVLPPLVGKPRMTIPDGPGFGWASAGVNQVNVTLMLLNQTPADINFEIEFFGS